MLRRLGEGAMGEVYAAKDSFLRRRVAFKRMNQAVAKSPALAARFLKEAQITAQLEHPNIIPIYGLESTADGSVGYAMKFIEGQTLTDLIETARAEVAKGSAANELANMANRLRIFTRICDAIAYAHAKSVLHRDAYVISIVCFHVGHLGPQRRRNKPCPLTVPAAARSALTSH
jgi:serine/threonine-protein kinase